MLVKFVTTGGVPYAEIEILGPFGFMNIFSGVSGTLLEIIIFLCYI